MVKNPFSLYLLAFVYFQACSVRHRKIDRNEFYLSFSTLACDFYSLTSFILRKWLADVLGRDLRFLLKGDIFS